MITAKDAARHAKDYLTELLGVVYSVSLEEVETTADGFNWLVTLSYSEDPFSRALKYRTFTIDRGTGEVKAMKIRQLT
jgi:hypothetical protein